MKRRAPDFDNDYEQLLAAQRLSWKINFLGQRFSESVFRVSLRAGAQRGEIQVYEVEDELIGWLWLQVKSRRVRGHVKHIQVEESHWGEGWGRRIMLDAIAMCVDRGCRAVTLNVTKSNARAMALYTNLGFVVAEQQGTRQRMRLGLPRKP